MSINPKSLKDIRWWAGLGKQGAGLSEPLARQSSCKHQVRDAFVLTRKHSHLPPCHLKSMCLKNKAKRSKYPHHKPILINIRFILIIEPALTTPLRFFWKVTVNLCWLFLKSCIIYFKHKTLLYDRQRMHVTAVLNVFWPYVLSLSAIWVLLKPTAYSYTFKGQCFIGRT